MPFGRRPSSRIGLAIVLLAVGTAACRTAGPGTTLPEPWPAATLGTDGDGPTPPAAAPSIGPAADALVRPGAPAADVARLDLAESPVGERSGTLAAGAIDRFVAAVVAGSTLSVDVSSVDGAVIPALMGDDGTSLKYHTDGASAWRGEVPSTQDYHLTIVNTAAEDRAYGLRVALAEGAAPEGAAPSSDASAGGTELFAPSSRVTVRQVDATPGRTAQYGFTAGAGEMLLAALEPLQAPPPLLVVRDEGGRRIPGATPGAWRGELPSNGTYVLEVHDLPTAGAVLAARLVTPRWIDDAVWVARYPDSSGDAAMASQIPLGAGAFGGGRYRLPSRSGGRLTIRITALAGADRAIVTVFDAQGRLIAVREAEGDGSPQSVGPLDGDATVSLLFAGGASGATVAYEALLSLE